MTMYRGSKFFGGEKKREKSLLQKAVLTFLMTGVVAWPSFSPVYADALDNSNIVRTDGGVNVVTNIAGGGLKTDIYVGKQHDAIGVNAFSKFDVRENDIANLRFHSQDNSYTATHLLNFVNDRINIHGTVNAIRNNKIGGNLYFISSDGMLVGKTGAINAGALTVIVPQYKYIEGAFDAGGTNAGKVADKVLKGRIQDNIPLNRDGSIVVNGTIRTALETRLMSANIAVGKEVDAQGHLTGADTDTSAKILTGVDFSNIVNTDGLGIYYADTNLVVKPEGDGTEKLYRLALQTETVDDKSVSYVLDEAQSMRSDGAIRLESKLSIDDFSALQMISQQEQNYEEVLGKVNLKTNIEVGQKAVLDSAGSTNISACVNASPAGMTDYFQLGIMGAEADVKVDGTINAGTAVNITAETTSVQTILKSIFSKINRVSESVSGLFNGHPENPALAAAVTFLSAELKPFFANNKVTAYDVNNKTNIVVGQNARVTAQGDVKVAATSTVSTSAVATVNPTSPSVETGQGHNYKTHPFENIALALTIIENMSDVDVEGHLTSIAGNVTESATAKSSSTTSPTIGANGHTDDGQEVYSSYANASVGVDLVKNHASATVGAAAGLSAAMGTVAVKSNADTGVNNYVSVGTDQRAALNTAVGYVNIDAGASTKVNGQISGLTVNIVSDATISDNDNLVSNSSKYATTKVNGAEVDNAWESKDNFELDAQGKAKGTKNSTLLGALLDVLGYSASNGDSVFDKFDAGAAIAISDLENKGETEIGNTAKIKAVPNGATAGGNLTIGSNAVVASVCLDASSSSTASDKRDTTKVGVNLGVAVENIDNLASTVIVARDALGATADIYAPDGSVVISATTSVGNLGPVTWALGAWETIKSVPEEFVNVWNFLSSLCTEYSRTLEEYDRVFGTDAGGGSTNGQPGSAEDNLKNANNGDGSLYAEEMWKKLQEVETKTNGGLSRMLEKLPGFNEAYEQDMATLLAEPAAGTPVTGANPTDTTPALYNNGANEQIVDLTFEKQTIDPIPLSFWSTVKKIEVIYKKLLNPVSIIGNVGASAQSGNMDDTGSTLVAFTGAAAYLNSNSNSQTVIGRNVQIDGKNITVSAQEKQFNINLLTGSKSLWKFTVPSVYDESAKFAIGGTAAINNIGSDATVLVAEGSVLKATEGIDVSAQGDDFNLSIILGGGKSGENADKISLGLNGLAAVLTGHNNVYVGVDDEARLLAGGNVNITGDSDNILAAGILDVSQGNSLVIGATVGIMDYDVDNLVMVADNDIQSATYNEEEKAWDITLNPTSRKGREAADFAAKLKQVLGDKYINTGRKDTELATGEIETANLTVDADTSGFRLNITATGVETGKTWNNAQQAGNNANNNNPAKVQVGVAGSTSINAYDGNTAATVETGKITLTAPTEGQTGVGNLTVHAADDSFIGAVSGAAALSFHSRDNGSEGTRIAGAAAVNNITRNVVTGIYGSTISNALTVDNKATDSAVQLAAGLSLGVVTGDKDAAVDGAASVSYNKARNVVHAVMDSVNISAPVAVVNNIAYDKGLQIAGGLSVEATKSKGGLAAAVTNNDVRNEVKALIKGGIYNVRSLVNYADTKLLQIGTALSVGVTASTVSAEAAVAENKIYNDVMSLVQNATVTAQNFAAEARDGKLSSEESDNKYIAFLGNANFDMGGTDALSMANDNLNQDISATSLEHLENGNGLNNENYFKVNGNNEQTTGVNQDEAITYTAKTYTNDNSGNDIYGVAAVLDVKYKTEGKTGLGFGAGVLTNNVCNNFNAIVADSNITVTGSGETDKLRVNAASDCFVLGVAAGIAMNLTKPKFGVEAMGSYIGQEIGNNTAAMVVESELLADVAEVLGSTKSQFIAVAGAGAVSKDNAAVGFSMTYVGLGNVTRACVWGSTIDKYTATKGSNITIKADNWENVVATAVSAAVSTNFTDEGYSVPAEGAVALIDGTNDTEAVVQSTDGHTSELNHISTLTVEAEDTTSTVAVAGGAAVGGAKAGLGCTYAENSIGGSGADEHQKIRAAVDDTAIITFDNTAVATVKAKDAAKVKAISIGGAGVNGYTALQGSVAKTGIYKDVLSGLHNTSVDSGLSVNNLTLTVEAENKGDIVTSADSVVVAYGKKEGVDVAVGVALSDSHMITKAEITGTQAQKAILQLKSADVKANSTNKLLNVGIGVGVGQGSTAGVSVNANAADNCMKNDTLALVDYAQIIAAENLDVQAISDVKISNYVGALSVGVGGTAGVGVSATIGLNEIKDEIRAAVTNSNLTLEKDSEGIGLNIIADGTHAMTNLIIGVGVSGSGQAGVAVGGVVGLNDIGGSTVAELVDTDVTTTGNLTVLADDDMTVKSHLATLRVGGGGEAGVGVGAGVNVDDYSRDTKASVRSSSADKKIGLSSDKFTVKADSNVDINQSNSVAGGAFGATGGAGVSAGVSDIDLRGSTLAEAKNVGAYNSQCDIEALHKDDLNILGLSAGLFGGKFGGSGAVSVYNFSNKTDTAALVENSDFVISGKTVEVSDVIKAVADSSIKQTPINIALAVTLGGSGAVQVINNDFEQLVRTVVKDSCVESFSGVQKNLSVLSENKLRQNLTGAQITGSIGAVGVTVGSNAVNTATLTQVVNSSLRAGTLNVGAKEDLGITDNLGVGGLGVGVVDVSVLHNNFGMGLTDSYTVEYQDGEEDNDGTATKTVSTKQLQGFVAQGYTDQKNYIGALYENNLALKKGGVKKTEVLPTETVMYTGSDSQVATSKGVAQGLNTLIDSSSLKAVTGNITVYTDKDVTADVELIGVKVAGLEVGVISNRLALDEKNALKITDSTLNAEEGDIVLKMERDGKLYNHGTQVGVSVVGVAVNDTYTHREGSSDLQVQDSELTAETGKILLTNEDDTKLQNKLSAVKVEGVSVSVMTSKVEDEANANITLGNTAFGVDSTGVKLTGTAQDNSVFKTQSIDIATLMRPELESKVILTDVSAVGGSGSISKVNLSDNTLISVADNVTLNAEEVTLDSSIALPVDSDGNMTKNVVSHVDPVAVSAVTIAINKSMVDVDADAKLLVGNIQLPKAAQLGMNSFNGIAVSNDINVAETWGIITIAANKVKTELDGDATTLWRMLAGDALNLGSLSMTAESSTQDYSQAEANGGAVVQINVPAVKVENKDVSNTYAVFQGANRVVNVSGDLRIETAHLSDLSMLADSSHISFAGGGGANLDNDVTVNSRTDVTGANLKVGGKTYIDASGMVNLNKIDQTLPEDERFEPYIMRTSGVGPGGLLQFYYDEADSTVHFNSKVNIVDSVLHGNKSIVLRAYANGDIHVTNFTKTSGVFGGTGTDLDSEVKTDDEVLISNSQIYTDKEGQDISVVAQDELKGGTKGYAEMTAALAGGVGTDVTNNMERKNIITITGNSKLHSLRDINLYANRDERGNDGLMEWQLRSVLFCGSLISTGASTSLDNSMKQYNQVVVGKDAATESIRHTNIYAASGRESIVSEKGEYKQSMFTHDEADSEYVSTTAGGIDEYINRDNYVQVLGSVTAGTTNKITINIGTTSEAIVVRDADYKKIVGNANGKKPVYIYAEKGQFISFGDSAEEQEAARLAGLTADDFTVGWMDYAKVLQDRYDELILMKGEYTKDSILAGADGKPILDDKGKTQYLDSSTYIQLEAEIARIKGLIDSMKVAGSNIINQIDYIELPDLVASGGNITVDTGNLYGSGNMTAKGNPVITVNNYTNLMLVTNKITVEDPGGEFVYNGNQINQDTLALRQVEVERINVTKGKGIPEIYAALGTGANIKITNYFDKLSYVGGDIPLYDADGKLAGTEHIDGGTFSPRADIEVNGNITSLQGNVGIENKHHDITIEGKHVGDNVTVSGSVVSIVAPNGSVTQGYTDGIVNIGGDVRQQYKELYDQDVTNLTDKTTGEFSGHDLLHRPEETDGARAPEDSVRGGWIAGGQVYINASDININGNIQSGFPKYTLQLSSGDQTRVDTIKSNWQRGGKPQLTDAQVVNSGAAYRIKSGGVVWSSADGCFIYELESYYRPDTDTIIVPSVNANGGRIYLTGRISSTGDGKIMCLDGAYNVDVKNSLNYNLQLGELVVNDTKGQIVMADSGLGRRLTYTTDGILWEDYDAKQHKFVKNEKKSSSTGSTTYTFTPEAGLNYSWVSGYKKIEYERYQHSEKADWWGWDGDYDPDRDHDTLDKWEKIEKPTEVGSTGDAPVARREFEVGYITTGGDRKRTVVEKVDDEEVSITVTPDFVVDHYNVADPENKTPELEGTEKWSSGYMGCHKHIRYTWKETFGSYQSDAAMVKADNPISIKFVGVAAKDAKVVVNSTGNKDVILTGNVGNTQLYSGDIEKGTVRITSGGSIVQDGGSIFGATVELKAAKDIQDVVMVSGKSINLDAITTGKGSVSTIVKKANGLAGKDTAVQLGNYGGANAGVAALTADGNIYQRTTGYYSNDVLVQGSRIDLTSNDGQIGKSDKSIVIKAGQQANATDTLSASVNARAYGDIYLTQSTGDLRVGTIWSDTGNLTIQVTEGGMVDALPYVERNGRDEDELVREWGQLGLIDDGTARAKAAIAEKTKDLQNLRADYQKRIAEERNPTKKAELEAELAEIPEQYRVWNKDQLLYAIQDSIINPTAGVRPSSVNKNPNLYGKNITLKVKNNAGLDDPTVQEINIRTLGDKNPDGSLKHLDELKALSQADAATVIWDETNGKATIEKKLAIGLNQTEGGTLTVTNIDGGNVIKNVYVEGREFHNNEFANQNRDMIINAVKAEGNVRLTSLGALTDGNNGIINARDLVLVVGDATKAPCSIGTESNSLNVNITGSLTATATGNICLEATNDLSIASVSAGTQQGYGIIALKAGGDITGLYVADQGLQGYIRSETDNSISLIAGGSIGDWDDANKTVRIKNGTNGELTLKATNEIVVEGVSTADASQQLDPVTGKYMQSAGGLLNIVVLESGDKQAKITVNGGATFTDDSVDFGLNNDSELDIYGAGMLTVNGTVTANTIMFSGATGVQIMGGQITGNNVTLQTGIIPTLTYGTVADVNAGEVADADVTNYNNSSYVGGIKAANLTAKANRDIRLGGDKILTDNADLDVQRNVYLAVQSVSGLTVNGKVAKATNVSVHNSQDLEGESCVGGNVIVNFNDENRTLELSNVGALGAITLFSKGMLENVADSTVYAENDILTIRSEKTLTNKGIIKVKNAENKPDEEMTIPVFGYIGSQGVLKNSGIIKGDNSYLLLLSNGDFQNSGDIDSGTKSVILISEGRITNRVPVGMSNKPLEEIRDEGQGSFADRRRYITAGKHVVMVAGNGLLNDAIIFAGLQQSGGNVILDDFEAFDRNNLLDATTKDVISKILTLNGKSDLATQIKNRGDITNQGMVAAVKGTTESGLVYMDSQGYTINKGDNASIYSVDGEVRLDATGDLINNKDIYVINNDRTGDVSCNVTLQATGNVYNTGDIHVQGKGAVLLDADSEYVHPEDDSHYVADDVYATKIDNITFKGVYNTGDIYASEGDVTFTAAKGDIYNEDTLTSASEIISNGKISMTAPLGRIINTKALYVTEGISLESWTAIHNLPATVGAAEGSVSRGLTVQNGNISLKSNNGTVENQGLLIVEEIGNVNLVAKGNITNGQLTESGVTYTGDIHVGTGKVVIQSTDGEVHNINGDIYVSNGSEASAVEITAHGNLENRGDIYAVTGDVTLKSETGSIFNTDELRKDDASVVCSGGSISLLAAQGDVVNTKALVAEKNITIDSLYDIYNLPEFEHDETVTLEVAVAGHTGMSVERGLTTQNGDIILKSNGGNIENQGIIIVETKGDVSLTAKGNIINSAYAYVNVGNVTLKAENNINNTGDIFAGEGDVTFEAVNGDIYNEDALNTVLKENEASVQSITYAQGSITMRAAKGDIVNTKALYATGDILMESLHDIYNLPALNVQIETYIAGKSVMRGLTTENGSITLISHGKQDTTTDGLKGLIVNKGILTAANGDLIIRADGGELLTEGLKRFSGVTDNFAWATDTAMGKDASEQISYSFLNDKEGQVTVTNGEIKITTVQSVVTFGDMTAGKGTGEQVREGSGNITLNSAHGNVIIYSVDDEYNHNYGKTGAHNFEAQRDMQFHAAEGYVYSDKGFISEGDMILEYGSGKQDLGEIKSKSGNVSITSTGYNGDTGLTINASVTAKKNIEIRANKGQLTISHDDGNEGCLNAGENIILSATKDVTITDAGYIKTTAGGITISSDEQDVKVAKGNLNVFEDIKITAKNTADLTCNITSEIGTVDIGSKDGRVQVDGNITSGNNISIDGKRTVDVTGNVVSNGGGITIQSVAADVICNGYTKGEKHISILADKNIAVTGGTKSVADEVAITAEQGNVSVQGNIDAGTDVTVISKQGTVNYADGNITSGNNISIDGKRTVDVTGNVVSQGNSIVIGSDKDNVTVNGNLKAAETITMDAKKGIAVTEDITSQDGDIRINTVEGVVLIGGDITATGLGKSVEILNGVSDIVVNGSITADDFIRLYSKGNNEDDRAGAYDERIDTDYRHKGDSRQLMLFSRLGMVPVTGITVNGDIVSNTGDIDIATYMDDISLHNITATGMAAVGTHSGEVAIEGVITGKDVTLYSESENANISFSGINVADKLILAGNNLNLDMSNITFDNDGCELYIYGVGEKLQGNITLDFTGCTDMEQLHIRQLNIGRSVIKANAPIIVDNLNVADRAEFYTWGTKTDVYGKMQAYDKEAQVIYYHDGEGGATIDLSPVFFGYGTDIRQENIDKLSDDPRQFETGGQGAGIVADAGKEKQGMQLEILSRTVQKSDSILLKNARDYSVYGQRYSVESLMQNLLSLKIADVFDTTFNNNIQFFNRYDNVAIPDVVVNQPEEWDKDKFEF